jgi:hypothetical protein
MSLLTNFLDLYGQLKWLKNIETSGRVKLSGYGLVSEYGLEGDWAMG